MRIVAILFVVLGVAIAGGAIYYGNQYISDMEAMLARQNTGPKTVRVIAAKRPLRIGDQIIHSTAKQNLQWVDWPASAVPSGAFTDAAELFGPEKEESRSVLRTIEPGELVLKSKVSGFGESNRIAVRLKEGMRAFTISVNAQRGVGGLVAPGDRVDIALTRRISGQPTVSTLMQNVLIIATDRFANTEATRTRVARTVTVEVSPRDAQKLDLAQQVGRLSLRLRGAGEAEEIDLAPVQIKDLPDQPEVAPTPEPVDPGTRVKVRKGGAVQEYQLD